MTLRTNLARLVGFPRRASGGSGRGREPVGDRDERVEGNHYASASVEGPSDAQDVAAAGGGHKCDHPSGDFVARRVTGDVAGGAERFPVFEDAWRDFIYGGRSLAVSALAALVLVVLDIFDPSGPNAERIIGAFLAYPCGLWVTITVDRWLYRRRQAVPPLDRFGDGRATLLMAAAVFWLSGVEAGSLLAPWLAATAVLIGSFADGSWIFIVSLRRNISIWRALRELLARERMARRHCWTSLFGEKRR